MPNERKYEIMVTTDSGLATPIRIVSRCNLHLQPTQVEKSKRKDLDRHNLKLM